MKYPVNSLSCPYYRWFRTNDNSSLPNNNSPDLNDNGSNISLEPTEEPEEIKFSLDYEVSEPIFWRVFEEPSNDNNELVSYDKLQERLVSTRKFFVGDAVLMIEHMEKIGKIEQTENYHVYRRRKPASPE
jgi:hypothetical protein